jgi:opacity protein-like surface antigen
MKKIIAGVLCAAITIMAASASESGYKLQYDGGTIANAKAGDSVTLFMEGSDIRIVKNKQTVLSIPASAVTDISFGQDVHRRVGTAIGLATVSFGIGALMMLSKSKKHFIGLTWDGDGTKGGFAFQADKNDYRGVLAGLEGITGKKAVNSDALNVKN